MQILSLVRERFEAALTGLVENPSEHAQRVSMARDPQFGDYQANIAMPLAKSLSLKPQDIAQKILDKLQIDDICYPPEIAGPGFINLKLRETFLSTKLLEACGDERFGVQPTRSRTYVVDYSAPNVAKPMHVGHIRSTVIGDAIVKILRFLGHRVVSDNHLGDWGTQFGMVIYGYKHFANEAALKEAPVTELSRLYRLVQQLIGYQSASAKLSKAAEQVTASARKHDELSRQAAQDPKAAKQLKAAAKELLNYQEELASLQSKVDAVDKNPQLKQWAAEHTNLETRAQLETAKLHSGDNENLELWKRFLPFCILEIESIYKRLNVQFDHQLGESFYHPQLSGLVKRLKDSNLAVESDGAICIFIPGFDSPMIVQKSDGAFLYATTDLATIEYRLEHFSPNVILYVVDHRQGEHFSKLFAAAKSIGYENVEFVHVSFGTVLGSDGKPFKTRSGDVIGLDYLLDEAIDRAYQVVCNPERLLKSGLNMTEEEKRQVAEVVGLGAIKYADLSHNRTSDYEFNTDQMVQLDGNTAAYIQYSYARTRGILRNAGQSVESTSIPNLILNEPAERTIALQLLQFEDALLQSVDGYYPSVLAAYLYGVAKQFAVFFDQCPVLKAESKELRESRLALCHAVGKVLEIGLNLLGIDVVPRM